MTEAPSGPPSDADTDTEGDDYTFEKAYSLYRLHREADASQALQEIKGKGEVEVDRGVLHLEAQLVRLPHLLRDCWLRATLCTAGVSARQLPGRVRSLQPAS